MDGDVHGGGTFYATHRVSIIAVYVFYSSLGSSAPASDPG